MEEPPMQLHMPTPVEDRVTFIYRATCGSTRIAQRNASAASTHLDSITGAAPLRSANNSYWPLALRNQNVHINFGDQFIGYPPILVGSNGRAGLDWDTTNGGATTIQMFTNDDPDHNHSGNSGYAGLGTTNAHENRPESIAAVFIMRIY
jgi:hypothetical protein